MIDPRALQQHFKSVQQRQEPKRVSVPRVPDPKPLTAIEAIPVPEPTVEQEEIPVIEPIVLEEPKVIEEPEQEVSVEIAKPKDENLYDNSAQKEKEEYDPYGYYSGPKF